MAPLWTITLFAELTVRPGAGPGEESVRRFRSQKVAALLAYLAFHRGQTVSREFLCDLLWPDEAEAEVTRNRLRVTLTSLRRQLEPPGVPSGAVIESVGNYHVRLRPEAVDTDVAAFEAALRRGDVTSAATLYRGPLLPAFYEEWIPPEQARLSEALAHLQAASPVRGDRTVPAVPEPTPITNMLAVSVAVPLYLTRFFGREAERGRIAILLSDPQTRLITLTGPGGIGKTRLATEAVRNHPALCAFVPLADVWDAGQLGQALRQALPIPPTPHKSGGDTLASVVEHLNSQPVSLIVLDNVEQIAQGAALIIGELLARVPSLTLIVTSRRRLDFPGEYEIPVAPLSLPVGVVVEQIVVAPSVQLFLDRAQSTRPDYQITPRNAADIAALCCLVDGIPLALELAAARVGTLTPEQIRFRLEERLADAGMAIYRLPAEKRHRSMQAVIEWSYALLPPDLRHFFMTLSIFRGGWDLAAAEAVTGEAHALDSLSRLRGHSLVTMEGSRFRLLETLRSWAEERLGKGEERAALAGRHTRYYLEWGERSSANVGAADESRALDSLEMEEANLRAAFAYALEKGDTDSSLCFALILYTLGRARGSLSESLGILDRALTISEGGPPVNDSLRVRALLAAGELTQLARGAAPAYPLLKSALTLARQTGDGALTARALRDLADNALFRENYEAALPLYEEALALQRAADDARSVAQTLNSLALLARREDNDFIRSARLTRESGDYFRRVGDRRMLSYSLFNLGELALEQGETELAVQHFGESLALAEELRDDWQRLYALFALARIDGSCNRDSMRHARMRDVLSLALHVGDLPMLADALAEQAKIAHADGDPRRAVTLLAAAKVVNRQEAKADSGEVTAKVFALTERAFHNAWNKGIALTPEAAVAFALASC